MIRCTSLIPSPALGAARACTAYLKAENLQLTGSFKIRGALNKLIALKEAGYCRVATASSGNHGMAVAYSLRLTGLQGRIFLPRDVSVVKLRALEEQKVYLELVNGECLDAERAARKWSETNGVPYIAPYNDPEIVGGQGTLGIELSRQFPQLDTVFIAVGGGGLISGIAPGSRESTHRSGLSPVHRSTRQ